MARPKSVLAKAIENLDILDGRKDRHYTNLPLDTENTTGVCSDVEKISAGLNDKTRKKTIFHVAVQNPNGKEVKIDCNEMTKKLEALITIANKNPATAFIARMNIASPKDVQNVMQNSSLWPSGEEYFGHNLVDHMIAGILLGLIDSTKSWQKIFSMITPQDLATYSTTLQAIGQQLNISSYQKIDVKNSRQAAAIFKRLGKKYGFDTTEFQPPKSKKTSRKK